MTRARHLLDLDGADRATIEKILARAADFKRGVPSAACLLHDRVVVGMFFEASTRTALSFAVASHRLGAHWIELKTESSSITKGESLEDTMRTIRAVGADALVVRHRESGFAHALTPHFGGCIINAGDGCHAHPTQGLLDALTLQEEFGSLEGRRLVISGDIKHSRVARSSARAAWLLGAHVTLCAPPSLLPSDSPAWGFAAASSDLDAELPHADALMLLRIQGERIDAAGSPPREDLALGYGLDARRFALLPAHAIVMHPGPVNRGVEIAPVLVTDARSRIERQVENGTFARMAVLESCIGALA